MNLTTDRHLHTLAAVCRGSEFVVLDDARMVVRMPHGLWEVFGDELDALLDRGWVELTGDGEADLVRPTWAGVQAMRAWERELKRGGARCSSSRSGSTSRSSLTCPTAGQSGSN